jgi:hypothetical protein
MENQIEYKILEGYPSDVQKKLNQWKHEYKIEVLGFSAFTIDGYGNVKETRCVMPIIRRKR